MPNPDQILSNLKRLEGRQNQGRLKIYLGMVAGVGKTYAMLKDAHTLHTSGMDVVVGFIETHGRAETAAQIGDLEVLPRKIFGHRGVMLEEMDIDAVLKRKPKIVLVDELAHTNVPGSRHTKRFHDVLEILGQGIDVYTTLNVQHLLSRADTVAQFSGVIQQEIVPDSVLDRADEVLFIDQNPDVVLERLRAGKIYPAEKAQAAATNFFKPGNLTALREMGLRTMAERVDHELSELKTLQGIPLGARTHHRLLVAVFASPFSEYLVRWTRRHAYALNCPWDAVYVRRGRTLTDEEEALLKRNITTVRDLGGEMIEVQDESLIHGILTAAHDQGTTQLVLGRPRPRPWWFAWRRPLVDPLVYGQDTVDVHIISPPERATAWSSLPRHHRFSLKFPHPSAIANSLLVVAITTGFNAIIQGYVAYYALGLLYMLAFCFGAIFLRRFSIMLTALMSGIVWNFAFIPPLWSFSIKAHEDWIMLVLYMATAAMIGTFTRKLRSNEERMRQQGARTESLYRMTKSLASARDAAETILRALEQLKAQLGMEGMVWALEGSHKLEDARHYGDFHPQDKDLMALRWAFANRRPAGRFTDTLPTSLGHYLPLLDSTGAWGVLGVNTAGLSQLNSESVTLLETISQQVSLALGRDNLFRQLQSRHVREESEKIYRTLLNSVSHELRTPLTAIQGFADTLLGKSDPNTREVAGEIARNAVRLDEVMRNFLDMGRIEAGQLKLQKRETDLLDLVRTVRARFKGQEEGRSIELTYPTTVVLVSVDPPLVAQALENVLRNALTYTPPHSHITLAISSDGLNAHIRVTDDGPGLGQYPEQVFEKFWRGNPSKTGGTGLGLSIARAFLELHGGTLTAGNAKDGGATFHFTIPLKE